MSNSPPWFRLPQAPAVVKDNPTRQKSVIIIGSGLAGCHTARELARHNLAVTLIDASNTVAGGASGNIAGIVKPFVTRTPDKAHQFYKTAFNYLLSRFAQNPDLLASAQFQQCGVLQLLERAYPDSDMYRSCSSQQASELAGVAVNSNAIYFAQGGWLNPASLCQYLVEHNNITLRLHTHVQNISKTESGWLLSTQQTKAEQDSVDAESLSNVQFHCDTLVLANGHGLNQFDSTRALPITPARGQSSRFDITNDQCLKTVVTGKRYAIPDKNGVVVGASFVRDSQSRQIEQAEHRDNLFGLKTLLPTLDTATRAASGFCAIRATTPDRLPVVGPVPLFESYYKDYALLKNGLPETKFPVASYIDGLYVIGGFGSRGIVSAPYCARLLADYLSGQSDYAVPANRAAEQNSTRQQHDGGKKADDEQAQNSEPAENLDSWSALIHPGRFLIRDLRRAKRLVY